MESTDCSVLENRINNLEREVTSLRRDCCNADTIASRTENRVLLKQLTEDLKELTTRERERLDSIDNRLDNIYRLGYIVTGVFIAVEFFGVSEKILKVIG